MTKEQVQKKYGLAVAGITDELRTKTDELQLNHLKKIIQNILENSTDIQSESYWHQIICLVEC